MRRIPAKQPGSEAPFLAGANAARGRGTLSRRAEVGGRAAAAPGLCSTPVQASPASEALLFYLFFPPVRPSFRRPPPPPPSLLSPQHLLPVWASPSLARPSDHGAREVSKPLRRSPGQTEGRGHKARGAKACYFLARRKKKLPVVYFRLCTFISLPPAGLRAGGSRQPSSPFFALLFTAGEVSFPSSLF